MDVVGFLPVRGGSRSIPGKNIKLIAGRPLVHWTASAALECPAIEKVYVASDSAEIRAVAAQLAHPKLEVIDRDPTTCTDTASTESALLAFARAHTFERVVLIQATSPLVTAADLGGALARLEASGATSLLSVTHEHRFRWTEGLEGRVTPANYDPTQRPRRQEWAGDLYENGAFYITRRDALLQTGCRLSGPTIAWKMSLASAIELDEPSDWELVESLLLARGRDDHAGFVERAAKIKLLVSDVDGVLTDGGMYYGTDGDFLKKFNTRDGMGMARWREHGGLVALITGEDTPIVSRRAEKLGLEHVALGVADKTASLSRLLDRLGLDWAEVAYMGDDLNDLEAMRRVGLAACPADAADAIQAVAHHRCRRRGGEGCVRELVDAMLSARGLE